MDLDTIYGAVCCIDAIEDREIAQVESKVKMCHVEESHPRVCHVLIPCIIIVLKVLASKLSNLVVLSVDVRDAKISLDKDQMLTS